MDGEAREWREQVEMMEVDLAKVRCKMDRLWHAVESTDLEINDILPRIREHKERQEKLELAADEARVMLAHRREVLDDVDTITAYAEEMRQYLLKSDLAKSRSFIKSFVKEIDVAPGRAVIRHGNRVPDDSKLSGGDVDQVALGAPVLSTIDYGAICWTSLAPQQTTQSSARNPQVWTAPLLMAAKVSPFGGLA